MRVSSEKPISDDPRTCCDEGEAGSLPHACVTSRQIDRSLALGKACQLRRFDLAQAPYIE
jgi:hypothetical protein